MICHAYRGEAQVHLWHVERAATGHAQKCASLEGPAIRVHSTVTHDNISPRAIHCKVCLCAGEQHSAMLAEDFA